MNRLRWVIEGGGEYISEWRWICLFTFIDWRNRRGPGTFLRPVSDFDSVYEIRKRLG
jgi:hypothetical protein